jgi:hypothetical protein
MGWEDLAMLEAAFSVGKEGDAVAVFLSLLIVGPEEDQFFPEVDS